MGTISSQKLKSIVRNTSATDEMSFVALKFAIKTHIYSGENKFPTFDFISGEIDFSTLWRIIF